MTRPLDVASAFEIALALAATPNVGVRPSLDVDAKNGEYVLTVAFSKEAAELYYELERVIDAATARGFATRYGVDVSALVDKIVQRGGQEP